MKRTNYKRIRLSGNAYEIAKNDKREKEAKFLSSTKTLNNYSFFQSKSINSNPKECLQSSDEEGTNRFK